MTPFRSLACAAVVLMGLLSGCSPGFGQDDFNNADDRSTPPRTSVPPHPDRAAGCPSRAEIRTVLTDVDRGDDAVGKRVVCSGEWAMVRLRHPGSGKEYAVVRRVNGALRLVVAGQNALCETDDMAGAPSKIKAALGDRC